MYRRRVCSGLAVAGVAGLAGCLDGLLADLTTFSATPAEVADAAAEDAGYEHVDTREESGEEEVGGETVEFTNYLSEYRRTIDVPAVGELEAGIFGTVTTPQVTVGDEEFNPVGEYGPRDLAELVQNQYEGLSIGDEVDERTVQTLETSTAVATFEGQATIDGVDVDVLVDVARFEHGDDHVVVVAVYPDAVPEEADRVTTMIEGLEHE